MSRRTLDHAGYDPDEEGLREALCTLANGYLGTRGAAPETAADGTHYPGSYLAGLFDRLVSDVAGHEVENEDMVNVPNWLPLTFRIDDGPWFHVDQVEVLDHHLSLDLRQGSLTRRVRFRDVAGRETTLTQRRIVSLTRVHVAALETELRAENWSGEVTIRSALDATVRNAGVDRYRDLAGRHLDVLEACSDPDGLLVVRVRTVQSRVEVVEAARTELWVDDERVDPVRRDRTDGGRAEQELAVHLSRHGVARIEKVVAVFTSRDRAISEPGTAAVEEVRDCPPFPELLAEHAREWEARWRRFGIRVEGDERASLLLDLHLFHLMQVAAPATTDLDVGIPARGLHGEAYRGHIFWDEAFIFPLLNLRTPEVARSLLRYRHRRLPAARRAAATAGHGGAMFPWQSGSSGREESQTVHLNPDSGRWIPDDSHRQRHIGAAIAYNVWQYVLATDDVEFLAHAGAELVVAIARFWAAIATFDDADERYDIHHVVGPDEFHDHDPNWEGPGLRNNAYTNVMASWTLARTPLLLDRLPSVHRAELVDRLELDPEELEHWEHVSRRLRVPFHDGVVSQFEGYEALEELDWDAYRDRYGDIHRLDRILEAEGDDVNRYRVSKQADVLMLPYLLSHDELRGLFDRLGYRFDAELLRRCVSYYLARTSHGSTLSKVVHSWVLSRTDRSTSLALFRQALESDVGDVQGGTTAEGIHLGAMAGTVDLASRGYSGMEVGDGVLRFEPRLPEGIDLVEFDVYYRRRWITVSVRADELALTSEATDRGPVRVAHGGQAVELASAQTTSFAVATTEGPR